MEKVHGEEIVRMECGTCHKKENIEADIVFECWEFSSGPFPVFDCPFCQTGFVISKQVIDETEEEERKEKANGKKAKKRAQGFQFL